MKPSWLFIGHDYLKEVFFFFPQPTHRTLMIILLRVTRDLVKKV